MRFALNRRLQGECMHDGRDRSARLTSLAWLAAAVLGIAVGSSAVSAAEFRSIAEPVAILYDAPSTKAKRLWLLGRGYPVQVAVSLEGWTKIADATGSLAWVENRVLSNTRTVLVRAASLNLRESASDSSPVVLGVARDVVLDLVEPPAGGWVRVRHRSGATGFVPVSQVFGL